MAFEGCLEASWLASMEGGAGVRAAKVRGVELRVLSCRVQRRDV